MARLSDRVKVAGSSPAVSAEDELFPDLSEETVDAMAEAWTQSIIQKHKDRLAYQAAYQRDLRKAKPLGMKVKEWREKNG